MQRTLLSLSAFLMLAGCSFNDVTNDARQELPSPDGKMRIVLFCRDAGATTGFNTQMSVLGIKEKLPNEPGNAFSIDHGEAKVAWKKDGGILVLLDRGHRAFKKESSARGVTVEYREQ